jgi:hypothetical protein
MSTSLKILKFFGLLLIFIVSFIPVIFMGAYIFLGCNKMEFLYSLMAIPEENFWIVPVTAVILLFSNSVYLFSKLFDSGFTITNSVYRKTMPKKQVYHLQECPEDISVEEYNTEVLEALSQYNQNPKLVVEVWNSERKYNK